MVSHSIKLFDLVNSDILISGLRSQMHLCNLIAGDICQELKFRLFNISVLLKINLIIIFNYTYTSKAENK